VVFIGISIISLEASDGILVRVACIGAIFSFKVLDFWYPLMSVNTGFLVMLKGNPSLERG
jgi:hypothetical protein